jgi:hypothetical protein
MIIYNFTLLNLDRADILLNNFDKIRPHYIYYNLASIMPPILTIPDYSNCKTTLKELHDNYVAFINRYGSAYVSTTSILGFANQGFSLLLEKI